MSKTPALRIRNLKKKYPKGPQALKGVSLEVAEGQFLGLLGPNGAGKSTMIHSITGLVIPTSGTVEVFGENVVTHYQQTRQWCGLAPQEVNLDWFLTVEETLDFHGGYFGMPKAARKQRTEELLEAFSLTEKRKVNTRNLSGGMKRRVILARALMHNPRLLILDEPTAGVDVELRLELWHYMKKVNKEGTTILLTTHYIEEAEGLCDSIALIDKGELVDTGTPEQLKKRFKKDSLEDVYLSVVGREELSRDK